MVLTDSPAQGAPGGMPETEAERYRRIFAATEDGLWDATELDRGPGGSLAQSPAYYSPRFLALTGYSEEQFPPRLDSFLRCIVPEDQPLLEQKVGEARSRGSRRFEVDFRIRTRSGELRWWRSATSLQLSAAGELRALSGVVRDLTEERRAADQLRRQTELLNQIQRMTRVGGWELDLVHNTLFWTEVTRQIHEVPDGFVPDLETGIRFYASESVPIITECVNRAVSRGEPFDVELDLITATGRRVPVHAIGEPVRESGKVVRTEPETVVRLQCPCGLVTARVAADGTVRFESVPAFAYALDRIAPTAIWGPVTVDIAYGGAFYAILAADSIGLDLRTSPMRAIVDAAFARDLAWLRHTTPGMEVLLRQREQHRVHQVAQAGHEAIVADAQERPRRDVADAGGARLGDGGCTRAGNQRGRHVGVCGRPLRRLAPAAQGAVMGVGQRGPRGLGARVRVRRLCERCRTAYEFDDALVSERGTTVKCTNCGHQFKVRRVVPTTGPDVWIVRTVDGREIEFSALRDLQAAIYDNRVTREDVLVRGIN